MIDAATLTALAAVVGAVARLLRAWRASRPRQQ